MRRSWIEPLLTVALGLISVVVVVGVSTLSVSRSNDHHSRAKAVSESQPRRDKVEDRAFVEKLDRIDTRLRDVQAQVVSEKMRVQAPQPDIKEAAPSDGAPLALPPKVPEATSGSATGLKEQGALARGWQYVARHEYDPISHSSVLFGLVREYEVKGLSPERNNALLATIQQVNEVGVAQIIDKTRGLPSDAATLRLQTFLR